MNIMILGGDIHMKSEYLDTLLHKHKASFSETEKKIADYFKTLGTEVINKTLSNLSSETGVSEGSFYKFVKKLGFDGFQDFKISIASTIQPTVNETQQMTTFSDISKDDSAYVIAQKVLSSTEEALSKLLLFIEEIDLNEALDIINKSDVLHFFGQGASTILAFDSYHKFHRSHYRCNYIIDSHMQLTYSTKLGSSDCVFLFSHSGNTIETIEVARTLRKNNVNIISLTGNPESELVNLSDVSLIIYSEESIFRSESLTAKVLYLTLIDIIFVNVMYQNEEKNTQSLDKIREVISITRKENND